ncbi:MAG: 4Fe-4S binding protein [Deltaproteobacteria bacterium]|jgi:ferredoxin|nr:4Fe-4S binding protein [Deltaproteobacteria bacterium]MCL5880711.1 4Fe-4S binding protein [Deltaproteobacteria bacterium]MDA8304188.1 4Fe-4S binding protein [Deltaproteobacteria bacterium]
MANTDEKLQKIANDLLESGEVSLVIGYTKGSNPQRMRPAFITKTEDAGRLSFSRYAVQDLAVFLKKPEVKKFGKIGIVVKGCDEKALNALIQEYQVSRDNIKIIGVECNGIIRQNLADKGETAVSEATVYDKCLICNEHTPILYDYLVESGEPKLNVSGNIKPYAKIEELDAMSPEEKNSFWEKEFDKCIKCYACRQACPLCYCSRCIVEKNMPQWIDTNLEETGNAQWNLIRAYHLSGRCIGCGECERACPVNIPLMMINEKMARDTYELFGYKSGLDINAKPVFGVFSESDFNEFIK